MGIEINKSGVAYARNLARRSAVDKTSPWTFDAADVERLLGADGKDLGHYAKYHLGAAESKDSKDSFDFPFGKAGKVYRSAVVAAFDRATTDGNEEILDAASELLALIDGPVLYSPVPERVDGTEQVSRVDFYDYRDWQTAKMERTSEGYLRGRAVVTNIGVFPYLNEDGTTRYELRHPDDVFDPESLASLDGKPLTNDHPTSAVDTTSVQDLGVGTVHTPTHDAYHVTTGIVIQRQDGVAAVDGGKVSLSCGYNCDLVPERGNFHGTQYTHRQKKIRYNHVALVSEGRAGDAAKLRMDGAMPVQDSTNQTPTKGEHMAKVRLDSGAEFDVPEAIASHIDALNADRKKLLKSEDECNDAKKRIKDLEGEMDAKKGELDSLKSQVESWEAKYAASGKDSAERIQAAVDSRVSLLAKAVEVGAKVDGAKSDRDIQCAIIALETADSMDGQPDAYVAARADGAYLHLKTHAPKPADEPGGHSHSDGVLSTAASELASAYRKRDSLISSAWKRGKE